MVISQKYIIPKAKIIDYFFLFLILYLSCNYHVSQFYIYVAQFVVSIIFFLFIQMFSLQNILCIYPNSMQILLKKRVDFFLGMFISYNKLINN